MKISETTFKLLQNFSSLNKNLYVQEGSRLETVSSAGNIYAVADVPESFPVSFGVYDLTKVLSSLKLLEEPSLDFEKDGVITITNKSGNSSVKIVTSPLGTLVSPHDPKIRSKLDKFNMDDPIINVDISLNDLSSVLEAARHLKVEDISLVGDGETLCLVAQNVAKNSSDKFSKNISKTEHTFSIDFKVPSLQIIETDYNVQVNRNRQCLWTAIGRNLFYYIAINNTSKLS